MKKTHSGIIVLVLFIMCSTPVFSDNQDIYCHLSLVEGELFIFRANQDEAIRAVVNYPLLPGDTIYTNSSGKCELQFNNGTIIRLDKHTELNINTVLSPILTSRKKITTLKLNKGQIYSMSQVYEGEIFQVVTPAASIKMPSRSTNVITVDRDSDTLIQVRRGRVEILFNGEEQSPRKKKLGPGSDYRIGKNNRLRTAPSGLDNEFISWNQRVNQNFKEFHYGKSKVPPVIYRRSPGIVHFAERFSNHFGSWEYDELFGYVWKPADFVFHGKRPFFDANHVKINGELVLVPNQAWGWAPAHLGTWFWSKTNGWIWIPGDAFSPGICSTGLVNYPWDWLWASMNPYFSDPFFPNILLQDPYWNWAYFTPHYWITRIFGNIDLYRIYRKKGIKTWRTAYVESFGHTPLNRKPDMKSLPEKIRNIIVRINRTPLNHVETYLAHNRMEHSTRSEVSPIRTLNNRIQRSKLSASVRSKLKEYKKQSEIRKGEVPISRLDWNPDSQWARKTGFTVFYSARNNSITCPELKLSSRQINQAMRIQLKRSVMSSGNLIRAGSAYTGSYAAPPKQATSHSRSARTSSNNSGNGNKKK